jgi:CBS domain-containing protein
MPNHPRSRDPGHRHHAVVIPHDGVVLHGDLVIPRDVKALVVFAHGSGSSRFSPRNRFVAEVLQDSAMATLLLDLLTEDEERVDAVTRHLRFDIPKLAERLLTAIDWAAVDAETRLLPVGLFGASTGAAAALIAAARRPQAVRAVVSRGGRPDLAHPMLGDVQAPTLCIVGALDPQVLDLNREALLAMRAVRELIIVPGATHLFEEPGTLEQAADAARDWFARWLVPVADVSSTRTSPGPAGTGGRVKARDIMTPSPTVVLADDTITLAAELMRDLDVGSLPVVADRASRLLTGMLTDRDIVVRHVAANRGRDCHVRDHMSVAPLATVTPEADIADVVMLMEKHQVRRIPVVEDGMRIVGIIAQADLARKFGPSHPQQVEHLLETLSVPVSA